MTTKESVEQLNSLIEYFNNGGNDFNATDIEAIQCLLKENQELNQKYLNAVADYETTMFEKEQLNSLVNSCQEEIRRLKKQLEEKENIACDWKYSCLENAGKIERLENQQKEFIDYLTSYIELLNNKPDLIEEGQQDILKEVFDKFKEIKGELK